MSVQVGTDGDGRIKVFVRRGEGSHGESAVLDVKGAEDLARCIEAVATAAQQGMFVVYDIPDSDERSSRIDGETLGCPAHGPHPHNGMKCLDCPLCVPLAPGEFDPCAGGCTDPKAHAEGGHDV